MKKQNYCHWLLAALSLPLFLTVAHAQIVVQHLGANDPLTEGFELRRLTGNTEVGPVFDDLGRDAWMIKPTSVEDRVEYQYFLTDQERDDAMTFGWELSATVRFVDLPPATLLIFDTASEAFWVSFSTDPNGALRVSDTMGSQYSLGENDGAYHNYKLEYDPLTKLAKLWVDSVDTGVEFLPRSPTSSSQVRLLAGETATHANWNELTFAIIPEPATVALMAGMAALLFAGIVRRRGRARRFGKSSC